MTSPVPPIVDTSPVGGQTFLVFESGSSATGPSPVTYSYVVPAGVNYISAVAIGGGGTGGNTNRLGNQQAAGAGGGGALAYSNKIPVTPGETLTVTVGNRGTTPANSSISRGSTVLLLAVGGSNGNPNTGNAASGGGLGGQASNCIGQVCFSGGNGGTGTASTVSGDPAPYRRGPGGGGAAGYAGNGGNGATLGGGGSAPIGGGGGGGANTQLNGANGGGVGLYGLGSSGAGGGYASSVVGGSSGDTGSALDGGTFNNLRASSNEYLDYVTGAGAGGGGARYTSSVSQFGELGSSGAVRIIHGINETFPVNCTTNNISFVTSTVSNQTTITMPSTILPNDFFILYDLADYSTNAYTGSLPNSLIGLGAPAGWTQISLSNNSSTFTLCSISVLLATEINAENLQNSIVTGHGGTGSKSKVLLQFRSEKALAVYKSLINTTFAFEQSAAPGSGGISPTNAFPYSNGMSIVTTLFKADNPIAVGTNVGHTGANFILGASGTNTIVSYKIYNQNATTYSSTISMNDAGTNTMIVTHLLGY